ncbi:MAG TPA: CehA/McbA family metallohydrolase [Gemmataceae bacterium]|nr:CehA/McbA family metallohydrolase [Gemmataceae bacterium]
MSPGTAAAGPLVIDARLHHLRSGAEREWSDFPAAAEGPRLSAAFQARANAGEHTLRLRQRDVKQTWKVLLNGKELGRLVADENDTEVTFPVPAGRLADGGNTLVVESAGVVPDDIWVGEITLDDRPVKDVFAEATVEVAVREEVRPGERVAVPCRVTVLSARGALATTGATPADHLAIRPGVIYTATGVAKFGVPAGDYTLVAGRGFAYGTDTVRVSLKAGDAVRKDLTIRREVPTPGYAACDPHVHSLTHSGHGDATAVERAVTVAGEGLDLFVATDHNVQVDYHAAAVKAGARKHFTPIVGNEVTTSVGHFNVFPLPAGGPVPDFKAKDWKGVAAALGGAKGPRAVILNHPRDVHAKFRPFGPERHLAQTGEDLDGWELPANAVEVVNSGAQQTDVMRPVRDWFGLLNRGRVLTPVGSSDSHDVSRYVVGQGRTYVRCDAARPGEIDTADAVANFVAGRVTVSCGLLAEITVDGKFGPGDLVPVKGDAVVSVRVLGPAWAAADRVELYANGVKLHEATIRDEGKAGEKWAGKWTVPRPAHDVHLVAVATGPGVEGLFWPIAKPYQPTSPAVRKRVIGVTGAVWLDGDGDGKRSSAADDAKKVIAAAAGDWRRAVRSLAPYDEAVAAQAAGLLLAADINPAVGDVRAEAKAAGGHVLRGFDAYSEAWRDSRILRMDRKP